MNHLSSQQITQKLDESTIMSNIDISKIEIPFNKVLIKLDPDWDTYHSTLTGNDTGIHVAPWGINQASHVALTGTVIALPKSLIYHGHQLRVLRSDKNRSDAEQKHIAALRNESMAYDVPIELEVGYRVYFEYTTRLNAFKEGRAIEQEDGKYIFVPYDLLVLAFRHGADPENIQVQDVYPLNGFVLIKPLEYATERSAEGIVGVKTATDILMPVSPDAKYVHQGNIWYANVLSAGCLVNSYADFNSGRDGGEIGKPGQKIIFDGRQKKRLEVEHHRVIFKKHTLFRIHRKDIFGWFPDGKIGGMPKL